MRGGVSSAPVHGKGAVKPRPVRRGCNPASRLDGVCLDRGRLQAAGSRFQTAATSLNTLAGHGAAALKLAGGAGRGYPYILDAVRGDLP